MTFVGHHADNILFIGGMHDAEIGIFCVPHAEAVVVTGDEGDVFHAGGFGEGDPGMCIEIDGVEEFFQPGIVLYRDIAIIHHPFAIAGDTERTPVDEQTEFGVGEPFAGLFVLGGGGVSLGRCYLDKQIKQGAEDQEFLHV